MICIRNISSFLSVALFMVVSCHANFLSLYKFINIFLLSVDFKSYILKDLLMLKRNLTHLVLVWLNFLNLDP